MVSSKQRALSDASAEDGVFPALSSAAMRTVSAAAVVSSAETMAYPRATSMSPIRPNEAKTRITSALVSGGNTMDASR
ncbi:MAG: hypothetical protein DWI09_04615 [Planctomycetota bacterium]|nr:MAG: hypothetical protein DWI09_04615 [Planctomycetota bacterium]